MRGGTDWHSDTGPRWQTQVTLSKPRAARCTQPSMARHMSVVHGSPSSQAPGPSVRQLDPVGTVVVVAARTVVLVGRGPVVVVLVEVVVLGSVDVVVVVSGCVVVVVVVVV